jgi:VanZ family protein
MAFTRRHKLLIAVLLIYWPLIFIATHLPRLPAWAGTMGVSDKTLHFMAYLVLVFVLWSVVFYDRQVRWNRPGVWLVLVVVVFYGVADESLQAYVGRNPDVWDFIADLAGAVAGLIILTFCGFYSSATLVAGIMIFTFSNLSKLKVSEILPVPGSFFYLTAYAGLSVLWARHVHYHLAARPPSVRWLCIAASGPAGVLLVEQLTSIAYSGNFSVARLTAGAVGIIIVLLVGMIVAILRKKAESSRRRDEITGS